MPSACIDFIIDFIGLSVQFPAPLWQTKAIMLIEIWERLRGYCKWIRAKARIETSKIIENKKSGPGKQRNPGIDLLRGIAVFLVLSHHIGIRLPLAKGVLGSFLPTWVLTTLNWRGYQAVFLFFVISGFLIARNSLDRWGRFSWIHPKSFYQRRSARILPCFLGLLLVLSLLHLLHFRDFTITGPGQTLGHALFSALGLHLNWYEGLTGYLPANWDVLWSLSIEECFYLAFPLVCLVLRWDGLLAPLLALLAAGLPWFLTHTGGSDVWQEKAYLPGFAAIATGVLGALMTRWRPRVHSFVIYSLCSVGASGIFSTLCMTKYIWPVLHEGGMLLLTTGSLCLLLAFHWQAQSGTPWRLRGTGWLRSCGCISYEIYLTHMFIVLPAVRLYTSYGFGLWWAVILYPPVIALCWLLGWLVARSFSNPADRWLLSKFKSQKKLRSAMLPS